MGDQSTQQADMTINAWVNRDETYHSVQTVSIKRSEMTHETLGHEVAGKWINQNVEACDMRQSRQKLDLSFGMCIGTTSFHRTEI